MIDMQIQDAEVQAALQRLLERTRNLTPAMRAISLALLDETETNFAAQGRPGWKALADSTQDARAKRGKWPGKILQVTGRLAASVTPSHSAAMAAIGSNMAYAAIHQLGGQAGRGHRAGIPARPYLPMTAEQQLQPAAVRAVLAALNDYLLP